MVAPDTAKNVTPIHAMHNVFVAFWAWKQVFRVGGSIVTS